MLSTHAPDTSNCWTERRLIHEERRAVSRRPELANGVWVPKAMNNFSGRSRTVADCLDVNRVAALHNVLGQVGDPPQAGNSLPTFWHHIFFWEAVSPSALGRDGHPKPGGLIPDLGLSRRMWASGKLLPEAELVVGRESVKTSVIEDVSQKSGRSGDLAFVTLRHEYRQNSKLALTEFQHLVYRPAWKRADPVPEPPPAPDDESFSHSETFDSTLLFRFSALTFNGHRIHYDADYCRNVEGYPGLVVHGPLICLRLVQFAEDVVGAFREFEYRATSPLFCGETATFCGRRERDGLVLWVRGPDGRQCMKAVAR